MLKNFANCCCTTEDYSSARQDKLAEALEHLMTTAKHGCHQIVERNIASAQRWAAGGDPKSGLPLELKSDTGFEVSRLRRQPIGPEEIEIDGHTFKPVV